MPFLAGGTLGADNLPGVVSLFGHPLGEGNAGPTTPQVANDGYGIRVKMPRSGVLHDLAVLPRTQSGNIDIGVYTLSGTARTLAYHSGSQACPAINAWRVVGDPNLAVFAGQQLDLAIAFDNVVAQIQGTNAVNVNGYTLPASYSPDPTGATPILFWRVPALFPLADTAEAAMAQPTINAFTIIGRIA